MRSIIVLRLLLIFFISTTTLSAFIAFDDKEYYTLLEKDNTVFDKKLLYSRFQFIKKLLKKKLYRDALAETETIRREYTGRAALHFAYIEGRLHVKIAESQIDLSKNWVYYLSNSVHKKNGKLSYDYYSDEERKILAAVPEKSYETITLPVSPSVKSNLDAALEIFDRILLSSFRHSPLTESAIIAKAEVFMHYGAFDLAEKEIMIIPDRFPKSPLMSEVFWQLSRISLAQKKDKKALEYLLETVNYTQGSEMLSLIKTKSAVLKANLLSSAEESLDAEKSISDDFRRRLLESYRIDRDLLARPDSLDCLLSGR